MVFLFVVRMSANEGLQHVVRTHLVASLLQYGYFELIWSDQNEVCQGIEKTT